MDRIKCILKLLSLFIGGRVSYQVRSLELKSLQKMALLRRISLSFTNLRLYKSTLMVHLETLTIKNTISDYVNNLKLQIVLCHLEMFTSNTAMFRTRCGVGFLFATSVDTAAYWFVYKLYINLVEDTPVGRGYFIKNDCIFNTALTITDELLILILTFY